MWIVQYNKSVLGRGGRRCDTSDGPVDYSCKVAVACTLLQQVENMYYIFPQECWWEDTYCTVPLHSHPHTHTYTQHLLAQKPSNQTMASRGIAKSSPHNPGRDPPTAIMTTPCILHLPETVSRVLSLIMCVGMHSCIWPKCTPQVMAHTLVRVKTLHQSINSLMKAAESCQNVWTQKVSLASVNLPRMILIRCCLYQNVCMCEVACLCDVYLKFTHKALRPLSCVYLNPECWLRWLSWFRCQIWCVWGMWRKWELVHSEQ